jgi:hypothetical protein
MAKEEAVSRIVQAGLPDLARKAEAELPDPVDNDQWNRFAQRHGVTTDFLISLMGGSP